MKGAVVFATNQGLGIQAKDFYKHKVFKEVLVWPHSTYENHYEWYPDRVHSFDELLKKCDTIYFFETPFDWTFIIKARNAGVKTVLFVMYECTRNPLPYFPDVLIGGSVLETEFFGAKHINVPVSDEIVWRKREKARVFVHNAGHGGLGGRNGTLELIEAMQYVKSPIKLIIRSQKPVKQISDERIEYRIGDFPYNTLFSEGDVFIYPDKFGGSCLPLQEAFASGMMVMSSNRHPSNLWLPNEPLIPIQGYKKERISSEFDSAILSPKDIANTIDEWYGKDISSFSIQGKVWGKTNSWSNLKKQYEAA